MALNTARTPYQRKPQSRGRRFVFTLNNWTQEQWEFITSSAVTAKLRWMVVAREVGEKTGTPHLQGAFVLLTQMAFSTVKTLFGCPQIHLEKMMGTPSDSLTYCSKQDTDFFQYGTLPEPGKRSDLAAAAQHVIDGVSLRDLARKEGGAVAIVKFHKGLTILRSLTRKGRDGSTAPAVFWLHGATGTGKTRTAFELGNTVSDVWFCPDGGLKWFDGYDGQSVAIFDDFRSKGVSFPFLLRVCDRYPITVPFKGGFVDYAPSVIFITAPGDPDTVFAKRKEHVPEDLAQLHRRLSHGGGVFHLPDEQEKVVAAFNKLGLSQLPVERPAVAPPRQLIDLTQEDSDPEEDVSLDTWWGQQRSASSDMEGFFDEP